MPVGQEVTAAIFTGVAGGCCDSRTATPPLAHQSLTKGIQWLALLPGRVGRKGVEEKYKNRRFW